MFGLNLFAGLASMLGLGARETMPSQPGVGRTGQMNPMGQGWKNTKCVHLKKVRSRRRNKAARLARRVNRS